MPLPGGAADLTAITSTTTTAAAAAAAAAAATATIVAVAVAIVASAAILPLRRAHVDGCRVGSPVIADDAIGLGGGRRQDVEAGSALAVMPDATARCDIDARSEGRWGHPRHELTLPRHYPKFVARTCRIDWVRHVCTAYRQELADTVKLPAF